MAAGRQGGWVEPEEVFLAPIGLGPLGQPGLKFGVNSDDEFGLCKCTRIGGANAVPMELATTRNEGKMGDFMSSYSADPFIWNREAADHLQLGFGPPGKREGEAE